MPAEMARSFHYLRRNENRSVADHASERSLSGALTEKHFKYASRIAVEFVVNDEPTDMTLPMHTQETRMELPQTWVADPLRYEQMMNKLWEGTDE